jgi:hypothetical protein
MIEGTSVQWTVKGKILQGSVAENYREFLLIPGI